MNKTSTITGNKINLNSLVLVRSKTNIVKITYTVAHKCNSMTSDLPYQSSTPCRTLLFQQCCEEFKQSI